MADSRICDRGYAGLQDLPAMLALIKQRPINRVTDFPGIQDLQELLALPKIQANTHLWTAPDGQLACFAILDVYPHSASLVFEFAPDWQDQDLDCRVLSWAEASIRQSRPAGPGSFFLEASTSSEYPERIHLLERFGFERQAGGTIHMERSLADPIEKPQLPCGFLIRPLRGEAEAESWARMHRAALGTGNMTTEYKLAMMRVPYYDLELDLVVEAPGGVLAAYCVCFISVEENALTGRKLGHTDPIATHPDFQRRGLSRALMLTGLSLLKERGMEAAHLGTSSTNVAMLCAAGSVGFRITSHVFWYQKPIHFD